MAGTSWDKLGQMDAAFEAVAPAIRGVAKERGARLREFHNEDPVWRLVAAGSGGDAYVDVVWDEGRPDLFTIRAVRWVDDKPVSDVVGEYVREHVPQELEDLLRAGLDRATA